MTLKIFIHRLSANKNPNSEPKTIKIMQIGRQRKRVKESPADIIFVTFLLLFWLLYLVISLETVIGVPEQQMVKRSAKTERAT